MKTHQGCTKISQKKNIMFEMANIGQVFTDKVQFFSISSDKIRIPAKVRKTY